MFVLPPPPNHFTLTSLVARTATSSELAVSSNHGAKQLLMQPFKTWNMFKRSFPTLPKRKRGENQSWFPFIWLAGLGWPTLHFFKRNESHAGILPQGGNQNIQKSIERNTNFLLIDIYFSDNCAPGLKAESCTQQNVFYVSCTHTQTNVPVDFKMAFFSLSPSLLSFADIGRKEIGSLLQEAVCQSGGEALIPCSERLPACLPAVHILILWLNNATCLRSEILLSHFYLAYEDTLPI